MAILRKTEFMDLSGPRFCVSGIGFTQLPEKSIYTPFWVIILIFVGLPLSSGAQISGFIKDSKSGKPLSGVEVFVNQSSLFGESDENGNFRLNTPPYGFINLVLYKEGYELYRSNMKVQPERAYTLNLTLTPDGKKAEPVKMAVADNIQTGFRSLIYFIKSPGDRDIVRYQNLSSSGLNQTVSWESKRKELYEGSLRHWLAAMASGSGEEEGFEMKTNGNAVEGKLLISSTSVPGYYRLNLTNTIEVRYHNSINKITASGPLDVSEQGVLLNRKLLTINGPMQQTNLPLDYEPIEGNVEEVYAELMKRYYEKIYVHTDKPYYYQGEAMWFKAYVNYYYPAWRDSLSKVMYVELISPNKKIVMEKMLKIDSGYAAGDFILPDTLKRGDYYLRAYTHLQRNFGSEALYVKHIPILGITDKVNPTQATLDPQQNDKLRIKPDKDTYHTREKITLAISVNDKNGNPLRSNLSVSVTDAGQVVPFVIPAIDDQYQIDEDDIDIPQFLKYQLEEGITLRGIYLNDQGKPTKTLLNLVQWRSSNTALVETGDDGRFDVMGFDFNDSTRIFYSTNDGKNGEGKVIVEHRDQPFIGNYKKELNSLNVLPTESRQRVISDYEVPRDVRLLEGVEVVGQKFNDERIDRPYGTTRQGNIIEKKDIKVAMGDLNYSLIGKVPGLIVQQAETGWNIRITRLGHGAGEPLVTVNDVPMFGRSAGDIITNIHPATVESIEVKKSINVLYGSQGAFGVIAIYTQPLNGGVKNEPIPTAQIFKTQGFSAPRNYRYPDHSKKDDQVDLRSGLYWNQNINTTNGHALISFYAADLETTYRIEIEGVDQNNQPIRVVQFITIEND